MLIMPGRGAFMPIKRLKSVAKRTRKKARPKRRMRAQAAGEAEAALAAFAHEIRTSLTGILALGELLVTSGLGEREARWAAGVKSTAEHLASLINLIIDSARAGAEGIVLRREPFRLRRLADSITASLSARAETKGVRTEAVIAGDLPESVIGDAVRLRAALENLIDNAVKFTGSGSIKFELTGKALARGRLRLNFTVTDSGIGLKPAEIKRLFRPFAQASKAVARRYGGAGLGLVFVKHAAEAMGGNLTVRSKPGRGSTFRLTAIVEKAPASSDTANGAIDGAPSRPVRALKILCAEDNPYGRVVLNTILTELGHGADFVGDSAAAVEAVAQGNYDLVLMDVMLPGIDGIEATRRIRALPEPHRRIPVIGISGRTTPKDEARGRAAGMDGYVMKPISPKALAEAIAATQLAA
ncbi:MAG: two-component system, sensor histidine kinase [Alphaproteobacteria bacterium]|jgi:CheY-like chemotaxis protein|nr:two-component system, sensor histidine kinase [Alphaproteobacteria bacterium]